MLLPDELRCTPHGEALTTADGQREVTLETREIVCPQGCRVPVVRGIPRFVDSHNYAAAFGRQWKVFRRTQLDSYTGTTISRDRLARCLGGSLDVVRGASVLEVGSGAGRFTELLLASGARVFTFDLSTAVEANYDNCHGHEGYFVCQANILDAPVPPGLCDVVLCLGVIQHTPDPEETIARLSSYVKPGGLLVIDHYRNSAEDMTQTRRWLRSRLIRMSPARAMRLVRTMVAVLWPIHRLAWSLRSSPTGRRMRQMWLSFSPVLDYHDDYVQLGESLLHAWASLDTHDALTDHFKHKRSVEQITAALRAAGMTPLRVSYGGNGVEARARREPVAVEAG